jgi:isoquinoline 1-oxidoreductase beta subunit
VTVPEKGKGGRRWRVSRRGFLIGLGVVGGGVLLGWRYGVPEFHLRLARSTEQGGPPGTVDAEPTVWFEVRPDDRVALYVPKVEMGQGIHTALGQIAAEELEVRWDQLLVVQADTDRGLRDQIGTAASASVSSLFTPLREAAATLRDMLRARAAERFGVEAGEVIVMEGAAFRRNDAAQRLTFGELAVGEGVWEVPRGKPALKPVREFRFVGRAMPRVDFVEKLTGRAVYGFDVRLPGMLYGAVARPPRFGSELLEAGVGAAASLPGVVVVVAEPGFAGVAAERRSQAYAALDALELSWSEGVRFDDAEIERLTTVVDGEGVTIQREGRIGRRLAQGAIEAEYRSALVAHAHLEPQAAVVDVRADRVEAWVSTQSPDLMRSALAERLGLKDEEVNVQATYLGGGFGRKLVVEPALEAARLSRASGRPIHVGWSRTEDLRAGPYRPPTHNVLRAQLDGGRMVALEHHVASGDVAFSLFPGFLRAIIGADFGAWRGATIPYDVPNLRARSQRVELPVPTTWWRGLGLLPNAFALESFVDEVAHAAGADPLAFRLDHLGDGVQARRLAGVLERVGEMSGWRAGAPAGRGRGVAAVDDYGTMVAAVAEVTLAGETLRVERIWAAMDPGLVINPDGAQAQMQGSIVMALGSTLRERLSFRDGALLAGNFDSYPLLTIAETPQIETSLIVSGDEPFGVGEPPVGPVAAAVANALFALSGQRLRRLPLQPV